MKLLKITIVCLLFSLQSAFATTYYVSITGNDTSGDGSSAKPWRTLSAAISKVAANQGHTIKISSGTFIESAYIMVPVGVNIEGSGIGVTILKVNSSLHFPSSAWRYDKFLINLTGGGAGNQSVKNLTIDGDSKKLYGGIVVNGRNNVLIQNVRIQYTYFTGIWMLNTLNSRITQSQLKDCAWGSEKGASGSIILTSSERVEVDHCDIDEKYGQALEAKPVGKMYYLKVHDNKFSVDPTGNWISPEGQLIPNIAVEFFHAELKGCEVYNNYFDNCFSIAMDNPKYATPTGVRTIRVYNNIFDLTTRGKGSSYSIELSLHDAEIDHNYFYGGTYGIATWNSEHTMQNWKIHHNIFYGYKNSVPAHAINVFRMGIRNAHIYNNAFETTGTTTSNFLTVNNGGIADNVRIENNLIIDSNTSYSHYPNKFINLLNNATMRNSVARNNFLQKMPIGSVAGIAYSGNLSGDPKITRTGSRPKPYYELTSGSPLIDKGVNLGATFSGNATDIGAYEYGGKVTNPPATLPSVSITSPSNNASFNPGATIDIGANASYENGTITKVEFYQGSVKLGEDTSSPYNFSWANVSAGSYQLTAKATSSDNKTASSSPITVAVKTGNLSPVVNISGPANNAAFTAGKTITIAATASDADGQVSKVEFFNGTTKLGEDLSGPYEFAWANVPAGTYKLIAKATDNLGAIAESAPVNITVSADNTAPEISITIGTPVNNATFIAGETIAISANVTAKDGQVQKVQFFNGTTLLGGDWSPPTYTMNWTNAAIGTYKLIAKATDFAGTVVESVPVTITVKDSNALPEVSITSPANNATFNAGSSINITATATYKNGPIAKVEFFQGTLKLGEDTSSPYAFDWTNAPEGPYQITAKATSGDGKVASSSAISIEVKKTQNIPPMITITSPADNATFTEGDAIPVTVTASDADGEIIKVEFFNGTAKLGEDLTAPYSFDWRNVPAGTYELIARATDNFGITDNSEPVSISVKNANVIPTVTIISPANNATYAAGETITVTANANDTDGKISKVEFFNGSTKLGEDLTAPYSFDWVNAPEGAYQITAKTTDNVSAIGDSAPITINVKRENALPTVTITSPADDATFTAGETISITANATDKDGQIQKVQFFNGTTLLGGDWSAPTYTMNWINVPAGTYQITAKATDNLGAVAESIPVKIIVNPAKTLPEVSITSPGNNATFTAGATISLTATASAKDGQIQKVQFFNGSTLIGGDWSAPTYTMNWANVPAGTYQLTAKVTDRLGQTSTSAPITLIVTSATAKPAPAESTSLAIPRVFSPNNDGINDQWEWPERDQSKTYSITIFDRNGRKVFESDNYVNNWDGTLDGKPLPEDGYYYVTKFNGSKTTGSVRIIR